MVTPEAKLVWEELRPFEREIVDRFMKFGKMVDPLKGTRGWKGVWIRGHLRDRRTESVYRMWSFWTIFTSRAETVGAIIKPGTYHSFSTYVYTLKRLGLIREVRRPELIIRVMLALGRGVYGELREHVNKYIPDPMAKLPRYEIEPGRKPPVFYEAVPRKINDPAWMRPLQEAYPSTDWTRLSKEEKRRRRMRYRKRREE